MRKTALFLFAFLLCIKQYAQTAHFVYIQSEPAQPFYLKINGDIRHSSASGYLILSKLEDAYYSFTIEFADSKLSEQNFELSIGNEDKGYLLKADSSNRWFLEDIRTKTIVASIVNNTVEKKEKKSGAEKEKESFASLLAKASGDDELLVSPFLKRDTAIAKAIPIDVDTPQVNSKQLVKQSPVDPPQVEAAQLVTKDSVKLENVLAGKVTVAPLVKKEKIDYSSVVSKSFESSTTEGFGLQFIDKYNSGSLDTIKLIIPNPQVLIDAQKIARKLATAFPDSSSHCKAIATEEIFQSLLSQLSNEKSEVVKINLAKKDFSNYCFSAEQIKSLSRTFTSPDNKYIFLLDAYQSVSSRTAFKEMINQLGDAEITARFKLLLN
jgi:hypothetical protein